MHFYSRPCGRGDRNEYQCRYSSAISTHAPAGGATKYDKEIKAYVLAISTHAPAGGATCCEIFPLRTSFSFLLTPLREGRRGTTLPSISYSSISTHAPAGGATVCGLFVRDPDDHFYSRPCGRGDLHIIARGFLVHISTHAPAGGATRHQTSKQIAHTDFYSRPCGRGDPAQP